MKKHRKFLLLSGILLLTACAVSEYEAQKQVALPAKALQEKGNIPDDVFYSPKYEKLAIVLRSKNKQKLLAFYDVSSGKPVFYFETPYADDVFAPRFTKDLNMTYGLRIGNQWQVYLRAISAFVADAVPIFSLDSLHELVMAESLQGIYALGVREGTYGIYPPISKIAHYKRIEDFSLAPNQKFVFKAMNPDGNWIVYSNDQESEPYSFISRIIITEDEKLGYVAQDLHNQWFTVAGGRKIRLDKEYEEIGQVFVKNNQIVFSGVPKGRSGWEIAREKKILVAGLVTPPFFTVRENGQIAYTEQTAEGVKYTSERKASAFFDQIEQLIEDGEGSLFAKVKNQHGLWVVISGENKSDQYVWMSKMFLDKEWRVFFFGMNPNSGDLEFVKFHNK